MKTLLIFVFGCFIALTPYVGAYYTPDGFSPDEDSIVFEGNTADDYETTVDVTEATADRTVTLPDDSGNVRLWDNAGTAEVNLVFEGATANDYESTLTFVDPTASDKTQTVPDATGYVALDTGATTVGNVLLETEIDASSELLALMDDETGTGAAVFASTPTLVTPEIGAATGSSLVVTGNVTSSSTGTLGWSVVADTNVACSTTCTSACVVGVDTAASSFLACTDATADVCLCAGAS